MTARGSRPGIFPCRGFYVVVPEEYRLWKAVPLRLGEPVVKQKKHNNTLVFRVQPTDVDAGEIHLKVEINCFCKDNGGRSGDACDKSHFYMRQKTKSSCGL